MATLSNILLDKEILLESGTNELEVLVFSIGAYTFGINVAKVREVLPWREITGLPKAHPSICGVFKLRERVIPCVSLSRHLGIAAEKADSGSTIILTDFNRQQTAFVVDKVDRIYRLSWENILAMPGLDAFAQTPVTALARHENRLIVMLDFEMILDSVTSQFFRSEAIGNPQGIARGNFRILFAEDSPTVREAIGRTLRDSGYEQIRFFENGAEAWQWIEAAYAQSGRLGDVGDIVISDVEMPRIDGFHLTKRIKQHPELCKLPVLLYSSIVTPDNHKKGQMVGADAQVSKPELAKVVELVDELISGSRQSRPAGEEIIKQEQPTAAQPREVEPREVEPREEQESGIDEKRLQPQNAAKPSAHAPSGVDPSLWAKFRQELFDHALHLSDLFERVEDGKDGLSTREILRTLHTIKSAAMVVPLDPVARCTHLAEDLAEAARSNPELWTSCGFAEFLAWLLELTGRPADVDSLLDRSEEIEALLSAQAV